jgi:hypothetical protein
MNRFRTIPRLVRLLVALFVVAQFSGVVSSPRAGAQPVAGADAAFIHHQHGDDHGAAPVTHHHGGNLADTCCALHAYFAGVLPPAVAVRVASIAAERLISSPDDQGASIPPSRLDRPPRPPR